MYVCVYIYIYIYRYIFIYIVHNAVKYHHISLQCYNLQFYSLTNSIYARRPGDAAAERGGCRGLTTAPNLPTIEYNRLL